MEKAIILQEFSERKGRVFMTILMILMLKILKNIDV